MAAAKKRKVKTIEEAFAASRAAIKAVEGNAEPTWNECARAHLCKLAQRRKTVFCDELWQTGLPFPDEARALGAVFVWASNRGIIEKTGQSRPSVHSNGSEKPVWRSCLRGAKPK